ncbi:MAG: glycosyltransferase [Bacteroidales bacterium]|nr:glycosyltransferase [Bacteroidales bacterium]
MIKNKNAIFVTHPKSLHSHVTGGVQLCSQEFLLILQKCGFNIEQYNLTYTKSIKDRVLIKLKIDNYRNFNIKELSGNINKHIKENDIAWVFINMATLVRIARPIKEKFGNKVKIVMLSHGNHSGDFLHLTTKPIFKRNFITKFRDIARLGYLIHTESLYRVKYLDAVLTVSDAETQIENWFGAKKTILVPRLLEDKSLKLLTNYARVGFVGRLDHPPNFQGITFLLDELKKIKNKNYKVRLVGAPDNWGKKIEAMYDFVEYTGELSDEDLDKEVATWSLFLNTVFWYSTGVTTKLAWAINRGVPIVTTTPGMRGYKWKKGKLPITETPIEMANFIENHVLEEAKIETLKNEIVKIRNSSYTADEIAENIRKELEKL